MNLKPGQQIASIRAYDPTDRSAIDHVFRITADSALRSSPDPRTLEYGSHIWCHPYPFLHPEHSLVVSVEDELESNNLPSNGDQSAQSNTKGTAIGYILSAPDTQSFYAAYARSYLPTLGADITTPLPPDTDVSWQPDNLPNALLDKIQHSERWLAQLEAEVPGVLARYPAHLHIDILPQWQGMGWGRALMEICLAGLKAAGARGCHLQMVEGNTAARAFYKAVGFTQWGDEGKAEWCMVIEL